jgi:cytochrome d ubiquinol oxidase subunit II
MGTLWFCLVAVMIAVYVVLDGFDIGAGIVQRLVARTDSERGAVVDAIGPVWDGNEVWLLAGGGTLYFAFPALYASSFSGFYLPLTIVLWLLILRGVAIEFRHHIEAEMWRSLWDAVFMGASVLLAVFFGAALGNVVRGVPLDAAGYFFLPLWTDLNVGSSPGILDWYTILAGVTALAVLALHGSLWVGLKSGGSHGAVRERARALAARLWWVAAALAMALTAASFAVQPLLRESYARAPWGFVFPVLAVVGLLGIRLSRAAEAELRAFLCSSAFIAGLLTSAAFGVFPNLLTATTDPSYSLTVHNAAADPYGLRIGLLWWIVGMTLASGYTIFVYRHFAGKAPAVTGDR